MDTPGRDGSFRGFVITPGDMCHGTMEERVQLLESSLGKLSALGPPSQSFGIGPNQNHYQHGNNHYQ